MNKIIFVDDYPVAIGSSGIETEVSFRNARLVNGEVVDVSTYTHFYIDDGGRKHVVSDAKYQYLECRINDELVIDEGLWRKKNASDDFITLYDKVDSTRRSLYAQVVDPLIAEAVVKRLKGNEAEAIELEKQGLAAREKIQLENPWPVNPEA